MKKSIIEDLLSRMMHVEMSEKTAFSVFDGQNLMNITYRQLAEDIFRANGYFRSKNVYGQHIGLIAHNSYRWMVTFFAITASGNVAVLMNPDLPVEMLKDQCEKADVSVVCGEEEVLVGLYSEMTRLNFVTFNAFHTATEIFDITVHSPKHDETIFMMFTSGTTGKSKIVEISAQNLQFSVENFEEQYLRPDVERILTPIPFYHILGFLHGFETLICQKTICVGRGVQYLFMDMQVLNPTTLNTVPSIIESLVKLLKRAKTREMQRKYIGDRLKLISYGGATLNQAACEYLLNAGIAVSVYYGMTEMSCTATWSELDFEHISSAGKFCNLTQYCFRDGELLLSGPTLMKGYYKDRKETESVIENGWLHTGDLGYCDENGYLYLTGRRKNIILLSNGENVNPEEIEAKLTRCEDVKECLVFGDDKGICADIYTENKESAAEYLKQYNESMPMYRRIYKANYLSEPLPKTGIGKIKRKENK